MSIPAKTSGVINFTTAIQAHSNWKLRLAAQLRGTAQEKIDVRSLVRDNVCELGKWLHGEGRAHSSHPKFRELVGAHADFHRSAAEIAAMIERGRGPEAEAMLNSPESEFGKNSRHVVAILMALRSQFGEN